MHKELECNQGLCDIQYDQLQTLMKKKNLIKCFMGQGTLEVEAGELRLQDQLKMHSETVSQGKQYLLPLGMSKEGQ